MPTLAIGMTPDGQAVYGGLEWRLLPKSGNDSDLRTYASERNSTLAIRLRDRNAVNAEGSKSAKRVTAGLFTSVDKPTTKRSHSLAAAFAVWAEEYDNAALSLSVVVGTKSTPMWLVIVVLNGVPKVDQLFKEKSAARGALQEYLTDPNVEIVLFSDDTTSYPSAHSDENLLGQICAACGKNTQLRPIPKNYLFFMMVATIMLGAWVGYSNYKKEQERKARAAEIARRQAEDPKPKYMKALAAARAVAKVDVKSLQEARTFALSLNVRAPGWEMNKIECTAQLKGCQVFYTRTTGTFESLVAATKPLGMVPVSAVNIEKAVMLWEHAFTLGPIAAEQASLTEFVQRDAGNKLQDFRTVGMSIQVAAPVLWPSVPGVPSSFRTPGVVLSGGLSVAEVKLPLLEEMLSTAPHGVYWRGFQIEFIQTGIGKNVSAKAKVIGDMYVTQ